MNKELEGALAIIKVKCHPNSNPSPLVDGALEIVEQALLELDAIKESNPSKALKCVDVLKEDGCITTLYQGKALEIIRQSLLEAQETKKKYAYVERLEKMMKQKECVLRYVESEDCFAVKTILSDGWYKLTPEFVDNNVREEIKPLPLIEKNRQLREENAELKRVLEPVKKIVTETEDKLQNILRMKNYEEYKKLWYRNSQWYFKEIDLSEEQFDAIRKYFKIVAKE